MRAAYIDVTNENNTCPDTQDDLKMTPLLGKGTTWLSSAKGKATKSAIYL